MSKSFWKIASQLQAGNFVDLTHLCTREIPHFEQTVPMEIETVRTIERHGFQVQRFHFEGQWGTHVDAPAHFVKGLRTLDQVDVREMLLPLVVVDLHRQVAANPDYAIKMEDLSAWEKKHGLIPPGAFVALRTDWSQRWPDQARMYNRNAQGVAHTPGWSLECLQFLYEERMITANGHETIDTDPGISAMLTGFACERYILNQNCYQVELMARLDQCPAVGAVLICAIPKMEGASGFPARLFAICPPG